MYQYTVCCFCENTMVYVFYLLDEICLDLNGYRIIDQLEEVIKKFNMNKVMWCCHAYCCHLLQEKQT